MVASLALILLCQLAGEVAARGLGLPVPGPVIGLVLLFLILSLRSRLGPLVPGFVRSGVIEATGRGILAHLSLLFVPAGVGIVRNLDIFAAHGVGLMAALGVSTLLSLMVTAVVFRMVARLTERSTG